MCSPVLANPIIFRELHSRCLNLIDALHLNPLIGGLHLRDLALGAVEEVRSDRLEAEVEENKQGDFIKSLENFMGLVFHIEDLANSHTAGKVDSNKLSSFYMTILDVLSVGSRTIHRILMGWWTTSLWIVTSSWLLLRIGCRILLVLWGMSLIVGTRLWGLVVIIHDLKF